MIDNKDLDMINNAKRDSLAREKLILNYASEIKLIAMGISKRPLDLNDDELSISLIAFNEAIDKYDESKGMSFINYAKLIIHSRLVDYFRKQSHYQYELLDITPYNEQINKYEKIHAYCNYEEKICCENLKEIVEQLKNIISEFNIYIDELIKTCPKHEDTRETLIKVSYTLANNEELLRKLENKKRLPLKELIALTGVKEKVLERWRKYIITLTLILTRDELLPIKRFFNFK